MSLLELFCDVDDFCQAYQKEQPKQLVSKTGQRLRQSQLSESEMITLMIYFHQSAYRNFKDFYTKHVQVYLTSEFPSLVSYSRFIQLLPRILVLLWVYAQNQCGTCTGISFIDSTPLRVCSNRRIPRYRVFKQLAQRWQCSLGWFYGFKLHLVINERGEILAFSLTPANVDDRKPVPRLVRRLFGKLFGDRGYLSQSLFEDLLEKGIKLVTKVRKNMKNRLMLLQEKLLLRKRNIIETVNDQLKNISQIEHSRHRSPANFFINVFAGLIAYMRQDKKPAINWSTSQEKALLALS